MLEPLVVERLAFAADWYFPCSESQPDQLSYSLLALKVLVPRDF